jgi:hypothetical protein
MFGGINLLWNRLLGFVDSSGKTEDGSCRDTGIASATSAECAASNASEAGGAETTAGHWATDKGCTRSI